MYFKKNATSRGLLQYLLTINHILDTKQYFKLQNETRSCGFFEEAFFQNIYCFSPILENTGLIKK